jgi:hypothetical protein
MRHGVWILATVVGLTAAGQGHSQLLGFGTNSARTSQFSGGNRTNTISPSAHVSSPFRLGDLFPSFNPFSTRNPIGRSNIPDPNSPEYLKLFGYKKLY